MEDVMRETLSQPVKHYNDASLWSSSESVSSTFCFFVPSGSGVVFGLRFALTFGLMLLLGPATGARASRSRSNLHISRSSSSG
ncbi:hypothetical protein CYLTODRAFT_280237 [Cylindrobasidium torrendii FP15055 ss-10]|uniref:Uncharacterized protein n=1 Tax=Cylindrobasidium torrendii FP15055 ss-10 TaxID=1314674 RepID=A0A0D7BB66_9AGAR|nr:hypothetical protein CYLTODRAFT_280237 [Cylindrobasidium torrendii FP15055 ss-10]